MPCHIKRRLVNSISLLFSRTDLLKVALGPSWIARGDTLTSTYHVFNDSVRMGRVKGAHKAALTKHLPDLNSRSDGKTLFVDLLRGRQLT
jgi:hypothetical protein